MPIKTLVRLTPDELTRLEYEKRLRIVADKVDLTDDVKYAIVLVALHSSVVPGNYPALKADIEGVTGIQNVELLIDHQARATVFADHTQVLQVRLDIALRDDTPPVEE